MNLSWMIYLLFVGVAFAIGAHALDSIVRRTSLPARWVWMTALAGIVVMAFIAPRKESAPAGVRLSAAVTTRSGAATTTPTASIAQSLLSAQRRMSERLSNAFVAAETRVPKAVFFGIAGGWALFSAALLVMLVAVSSEMNDERRRWPTARVGGARVRLAPTTGPAVVGLTNPEIVVPRWLLERNDDEQRLVVVHESEHVAARDQIVIIAGWLVVALLPWHPAVWWMMSRLRLAVELDCDARVLRRGVHARSYGTMLIDIAGQCAGHRVGALALADKTSHLEQRLLAMTPSRTRFTAVRVASLGAVAALAILAACEARLPTAAEISSMDVSAAEKAATAVLLPGVGVYEYYVDGKPVTETVARALQASSISSINMSKPKEPVGDRKSRVTITTKGASEEVIVRAEAEKRRAAGSNSPPDIYVASGKSAPLVIIDGVVAEGNGLKKVSATDIESVEVFKGAAALTLSPLPAAANGVIVVKTKKGATARP